MSAGRVRHYFPTKEALVEAAFDRSNADSSARIAAKQGTSPTRSARNRTPASCLPGLDAEGLAYYVLIGTCAAEHACAITVGGPQRPLLPFRRPCERPRRWYP
ncbi:hypothetical protein ACOBQX_02925 [Actinokineospora sp. G85]|uniref:hypothetical protein n=1 Tax=Actinokineospora sp. G85 TaxID=3406626 RepID=UPI003C78CF81